MRENSDLLRTLLQLPVYAPIRGGDPDVDEAESDPQLVWRLRSSRPGSKRPPPPDHLRRMLALIERRPSLAVKLAEAVSTSTVGRARLFDLIQPDSPLSAQERVQVRTVLSRVDARLRDDLVAAALDLHEKRGWNSYLFPLEGEPELRSLVEVDWKSAVPILRRHVRSKSPRVLALALGLLHSGTIRNGGNAAPHRARLIGMINDDRMSAVARKDALTSLFEVPFPGRRELFEQFLGDARYSPLAIEKSYHFPICDVSRGEPEYFLPILLTHVDTDDRKLRDVAVECVARIAAEVPSREALLPLLPWLSEPQWSNANGRLGFIRALTPALVPEAVAGLIAATARSDFIERVAAVSVLTTYDDPRIGRRFRDGLHARGYQDVFASGLVRLGLPLDESFEALTAFLDYCREQKERGVAWPEDFDPDEVRTVVVLGREVASLPWSEPLMARVLEAARGMLTSDPERAAELFDLAGSHPSPQLGPALFDYLVSSSTITARVAWQLGRHGEEIAMHAAKHGEGQRSLCDVRRGMVGLWSSEPRALGILAANEPWPKAGLLALARLQGTELPLDHVATAASSRSGPVRWAAEAYLESRSTREARDVLFESSPKGSIPIVGRRPKDEARVFSDFDRAHDVIREFLRGDDPADEVFARLSWGLYGPGALYVVIRDEKATLRSQGHDARVHERELEPRELAALRHFVEREGIDDLRAYTPDIQDGWQYEYVHATSRGGVRVFMNNPEPASGVYYDIVVRFCELLEATPGGPSEADRRRTGCFDTKK